jgi:uncharacterized protein involved in response to NO
VTARLTDPCTSHAAATVATRSTAKDDVLYLLRIGPMSQAAIVAAHASMVAAGRMTEKSPQRIRTACAELVDAGLVVQYEENGNPVEVRMPSGYAAAVWRLA